ncbi:hypothetical protein BX666DRAFT_1891808, partial [Dichotomocladium elegans]
SLFAELVGDVVSHQKFQAHEHVDVAKQAALEASHVTPATNAIEAVHQAAFRSQGLSRSVFASPSSKVSHADVVAYAAELFKTGNLALIGSGISVDAVAELADAFIQVPSGSSSAANATTYFGGEIRKQSNVNEYALAFQGASASSGDASEFAALQVLKFALDDALKGSAKAFNFGYSDAGLFGIVTSGSSADEVASAVSAAAEQLKGAAKSGLSEQAFAKALAQAKFAAATDGLTTRLDRLETVGAQVYMKSRAKTGGYFFFSKLMLDI